MSDLLRYERELRADSALVERILQKLPPAPAAPERVLVKTDTASVDAAIGKGLGFAEDGIESRIELTK